MAARKRKSGGGPARGGRDVEKAVRELKKLDARAQGVVLAIVLVVGIVAAMLWWREQGREAGVPPVVEPAERVEPPAAVVVEGPGVHLLLGNPTGATSDPGNRTNYLMMKPYFALSYNDQRGTANWVSWRVRREDVEGTSPRKQIFDVDGELPAGFGRVTHKDYTGSGFDRGHLCPHGDRDGSQEMSFATYAMTNIVPQAPKVNQGAWADLEEYCRQLVMKEGVRLYVMAGVTGRGGRGSAGYQETIGGGKVTVPAECWKVVVVVSESGGADDLAKIGGTTRVIAVIMPNDNDVVKGKTWGEYRVSVAEVEKRTGYRFFDRLPADVEASLKSKVDRGATR